MQLKHTLTLLFTAALTGVVSVSCSTIDEPDSIWKPNKVKHTQLAIATSNVSKTTRMSAAVTQADEKADGSHFRGIVDLYLLPFQVSPTGLDCIAPTSQPFAAQVAAGDNTIPTIYNGANSKYYIDVELPVGTNAFLVYGRATGNKGTMAQKQTNGCLTMTGTTPADITFTPEQIVPSVTAGKAAGEKGDAIVTYLNTIFDANWADASKPTLYGLLDMVKDMKAGSSASVQAFVQEVYDALKNMSNVDYVANVLKAILAVETLPAELPEEVTIPTNCQNYPFADLGLPEGAAVIEWDETNNKFVAVTNKNNLGAMNIDVTKFVFPAELYYRTNSRIHTSEISFAGSTPEAMAQRIFNRTAWDDGTTASVLKQKDGENDLFTPNGTVKSATTVVAITEPLQYSVGRLDVKLAATGTTLKDNDDTPKDIPVSQLQVTGVLVGQQCPVDYKFHSKGGDSFTIYDSDIETTINATDFTHTLVLEGEKDQAVNVAIELKNNSELDIVTGTDKQIVPPGCKFYLIGQLDPTKATGYDAANDTKNRVFCQDFVTSVTFNVKDLKSGYYVIPPLSAAQLEFSLGVIDWKLSTPAGVPLE